MTRQPRVSGAEVIRALTRAGFKQSHVRGSHHYLRRLDGKGLVVVPVHGGHALPMGTLRSILRQAGISSDEFQGLL